MSEVMMSTEFATMYKWCLQLRIPLGMEKNTLLLGHLWCRHRIGTSEALVVVPWVAAYQTWCLHQKEPQCYDPARCHPLLSVTGISLQMAHSRRKAKRVRERYGYQNRVSSPSPICCWKHRQFTQIDPNTEENPSLLKRLYFGSGRCPS